MELELTYGDCRKFAWVLIGHGVELVQVNQAPTFVVSDVLFTPTCSPPLSAAACAGGSAVVHYTAAFANQISPGPRESDQGLRWLFSSDDPLGLFDQPPTLQVNSSGPGTDSGLVGLVRFAVPLSAKGRACFNVTLADDGPGPSPSWSDEPAARAAALHQNFSLPARFCISMRGGTGRLLLATSHLNITAATGPAADAAAGAICGPGANGCYYLVPQFVLDMNAADAAGEAAAVVVAGNRADPVQLYTFRLEVAGPVETLVTEAGTSRRSNPAPPQPAIASATLVPSTQGGSRVPSTCPLPFLTLPCPVSPRLVCLLHLVPSTLRVPSALPHAPIDSTQELHSRAASRGRCNLKGPSRGWCNLRGLVGGGAVPSNGRCNLKGSTAGAGCARGMVGTWQQSQGLVQGAGCAHKR